ncbi:hypothetical protein WKI71_00720 [Streptomyces sp. MS1.AVA.1]|uniref:Transposase n=1 Tax=Streptomyces machairae TaxID=3134109 RepID=A0ABU8UHI7_9ACTN
MIGTVTADPDAGTSWADVLRRLGEQARTHSSYRPAPRTSNALASTSCAYY